MRASVTNRKRESVARLFQATQDLAKEYAQIQIQVHFQTIECFVALIDRIDRSPVQNTSQLLEGVDRVSPQQIQQISIDIIGAKTDRHELFRGC